MTVYHLVSVFILGFSLLLCFTQGMPKAREKRDVLQLGFMLECSTNRSMWDYISYGCYCGLGGAGTPLDATDRCCQTHDHCYEKVGKDHVCAFHLEEYTTFYRYKPCSLCNDLSSYAGHKIYKFLLASPECRYRMCECDSALAACAKKAVSTFNPAYKHYNKRTCIHPKRWLGMGSKNMATFYVKTEDVKAAKRINDWKQMKLNREQIVKRGRPHDRLRRSIRHGQ